MIHFDSEYSVPHAVGHVVRFDPDGSAIHLGRMKGSGLSDLMELWFDCAFVMLEDDADYPTVLIPAHYIRNGGKLPMRLTTAVSTHMTLWEVLNDGGDFPDLDD